jgi:hypothetical protein
MRPSLGALATLVACWSFATSAFAETRLNADGSLDMAGHRLSCSQVRTRIDARLPNLGAAALDRRLLLINPRLLGRERPVVQVFVFNHECGHHRVGADELSADCWAVERGVEEGWLDRNSLSAVCRSFGDAPETATHPSGRRRCASLDRCFAAAEARASPRQVAALKVSTRVAQPRLVTGPQLVRTGIVR